MAPLGDRFGSCSRPDTFAAFVPLLLRRPWHPDGYGLRVGVWCFNNEHLGISPSPADTKRSENTALTIVSRRQAQRRSQDSNARIRAGLERGNERRLREPRRRRPYPSGGRSLHSRESRQLPPDFGTEVQTSKKKAGQDKRKASIFRPLDCPPIFFARPARRLEARCRPILSGVSSPPRAKGDPVSIGCARQRRGAEAAGGSHRSGD